jgi:hypothetical protein
MRYGFVLPAPLHNPAPEPPSQANTRRRTAARALFRVRRTYEMSWQIPRSGLVQTAKSCGLEPYRYLKYVFTKLPFAKTLDDYQALTPYHLDPEDFVRVSS